MLLIYLNCRFRGMSGTEPLIYYVYITARVYRNFDKENFKNISLLKSLKRELFSLKSQLELSWFSNPTNFPSSFLVASSLCLFQTLLILFRRLHGTREQQRIAGNIKNIFFQHLLLTDTLIAKSLVYRKPLKCARGQEFNKTRSRAFYQIKFSWVQSKELLNRN